MELPPFVLPLALALGLGLLVGLQREWATKELAGIRTFALITLLGAITALLAPSFGNWMIGAGMLAVGALAVAGYAVRRADTEEGDDLGITTEIAALVMYAVGVAVGSGSAGMAIVATGVTAVLLHWKARLHGLVGRLDERELALVFRLVLIALVILPALPDQTYGPYDVLNPFQIWLMVVLIVGISTGAYVAYRLFGTGWGTLLTGAMGGLISSTATTVGYSRRTREGDALPAAGALVITIASVVVFVRVLFEIWLVAPDLLSSAAPPLLAVMAVMLALTVALFLRMRGELSEVRPDPEAPSALGEAIVFGLLYAAVLVAVAAAREHFGNAGVYVIGVLSGLTDMDAITLSISELFNQGRLEAATAWRVILVGNAANLVFKAILATAIGGRRLGLRVATAFGIAIVASGLVLWLWPA